MKRLLFAVAFGLIFIMYSCTSDEMHIVVYSPHGKELLGDFAGQFEAAYPDIRVSWLDMGSQDALDRIRSEKSNPQADLWWGGPSPFFMSAAEEGLLQPYRPQWADQVIAQQKDSLDRWYGTYLTPEVITFNSNLLTQQTAPQDWDALTDTKWRGKIAIRNPIASGTMRAIFSAMIWRDFQRSGSPESGYEWLRKLDANTRSYPANPTLLYLQIARGEAAVTLWNLPDIELQRATYNYPFDYILPASGTPVLVEGIAVVAGCKHPELARRFYEFVTTKQALVRQAEKYFRIPIRNDIDRADLPPWISDLQIPIMPVDWRVFSEKSKEWMRYWDENIKGEGTN